MGASSSGLLDEAKINHIKGLVDSTFQSFSGIYRQQYSVSYLGHIHQEVEPKKEGRGFLLTQRPKTDGDEVLYQGGVKFSCWDEQGKKCRERYAVLKRDYKVEIHDSMETFSRGSAPKLVLQPAGGVVFTTEEESREYLEKACAGLLNGVKEDSSSSSAASSPDVFAVYLHLPYAGHTCFLFQQEDERNHFLSGLKACIRHRNLDPWHESSHESQAYARALRLYRQEKGCYESWEKLLGTEEQVLARLVMEDVLSWLQNQLQPKMKGKKAERIRQWQATVQGTYTLVLEQLTAGLEALREECRQTASASQALIRSHLDQIMSSHVFLEQKVRACISEETEKVCSESVVPYLSSILEALNEHIGAGILGMQDTLQTQMNSAFSLTNGKAEDTKKALTALRSISLDESYRKVENLSGKLENLKERFGVSSVERLVQSANLEMEQLLDSAVYTLEQIFQSSTRSEPSQLPAKMTRAKERVLKQLDYDSRVLQRRLYQEALQEITLPSLVSRMDSKYKTELEQFEQYIFSDYSSFILVHNVYDDVLRNILVREVTTVVQDAASKKSNNLLLDTSDLAISQYSLAGQTPPISAPDSPAVQPRHPEESTNDESATVKEDQSKTSEVCLEGDAELKAEAMPELSPAQALNPSISLQSPVIVVTQQFDEHENKETQGSAETGKEDKSESEAAGEKVEVESSNTDGASTQEAAETDPGSTIQHSPDPASCVPIQTEDAQEDKSESEAAREQVEVESPNMDGASTQEASETDSGSAIQHAPDPVSCVPIQTEDAQTESTPSESVLSENQISPDLLTSEETCSVQLPSPTQSPCSDSTMKISLGSLSEAIAPCSMESVVKQPTDRAVYLTGPIKDNWEVERINEEKQKEASENKKSKARDEDQNGGQEDGAAQTGGDSIGEPCASSALAVESTTVSTPKLTGIEGGLDDDQTKGQIPTGAKAEAAEGGEHAEEKENNDQEKVDQTFQPMESIPESESDPQLDSVSIIRDLVTEIVEVEIMISPSESTSSTDPPT
ncbi:PREDICTED: protein Niban-like [Cyprinodon variegatus]|uniref:Protein Niban-like n=1 Tax=Cyprinodon variegatus TaxID=28743 RepID=A0A3Q2EAL9_CYPVA|nr:PREDICTED: protein Niban-like [Cyprinodon variegatus]